VPTYQYACTACGEQHEAVQAFSDAPLTECPACGGTLRKVFSAVGVVFKGSGFYKTDSRAAKKDAAPSSGTSESTPATKTDAASSTPAKTDTSASKPASTPAAKTA
jgi:putative FmdB family regulatory protein